MCIFNLFPVNKHSSDNNLMLLAPLKVSKRFFPHPKETNGKSKVQICKKILQLLVSPKCYISIYIKVNKRHSIGLYTQVKISVLREISNLK